jgi:hypothetical protein
MFDPSLNRVLPIKPGSINKWQRFKARVDNGSNVRNGL